MPENRLDLAVDRLQIWTTRLGYIALAILVVAGLAGARTLWRAECALVDCLIAAGIVWCWGGAAAGALFWLKSVGRALAAFLRRVE